MMSESRFPARNSQQLKLEKCVFCEFVRHSIESEKLEEEDEKLFLCHLSASHGLER